MQGIFLSPTGVAWKDLPESDLVMWIRAGKPLVRDAAAQELLSRAAADRASIQLVAKCCFYELKDSAQKRLARTPLYIRQL